jgi:hypothetical protein
LYICLALCLLCSLENIGSVYPSMSMIVKGYSLLHYSKTKMVQSDVRYLLTCTDDDS